MKLTFKDLKQQKFVIEAEPLETIADVKSKISSEKGWEPSLQKLIFSGKILQDDKTVESYNIEEKGFIVCMVSKPKAPAASSASKAVPSTPGSASAQTPSVPPAPTQSATLSAPSAVPSTPSPAPAAPSAPSGDIPTFNDPTAITLGPQREAAIANMESMGFLRADIDRAMQAAYSNPDRAVEYLLNGIPESAASERPPATSQTASNNPASGTGGSNPGTATSAPQSDEPINLFDAAAQAGHGGRGGRGGTTGTTSTGNTGSGGGGGVAGAGAGAGAGGDGATTTTRGSGTGTGAEGEGGARAGSGGTGAAAAATSAANLASLDFLRSNPQFQQLRQLVQQQPQMLEPILQQVAAGNPQLVNTIASNPDQFLSLLSEDADEDTPIPPGAQTVSVTEEERDAIERLCRLGFERDLVIQAYFACDKNEELAANYLFDHPDDEGGDQQ